jgi:hypothetical protein
MVKSPIATLLAATVFQFYVSIVDPSILAQPLAPTDPSVAPTAVTTVAAPATNGNTNQTQNGAGQLTGTAGALQQGATQPTTP